MKKSISSFVFLCFVLLGYGKEFTHSSPLTTLYAKGYQQVDLSPQLLGLLNHDYSDLRLLDSNQQEVPYILRKENLVSMHSFFKEYPLLINRPQPNGTSVIVFQNQNKKALQHINFVVKNTAVNKSARLSGSNDQENWYLIRDHISLHSMQNREQTTELKLLNFPKSDYSYFKLEINDSNSLPIQFEKVGYYDFQNTDGRMTVTPMPIISVKDSTRVTYIHLKNDSKTRVERIRIQVLGTESYYRLIHFKLKKSRTTRKGKKQIYYENIGSFYLNSNTENLFNIGQQNIQDLYLEIENGDDQPLQVEHVETYLLKNYMVAELDPSMAYSLVFGNPKVRAPKYDLRHFAENIPSDIPIIQTGKLLSPHTEKVDETSLSWLDNKWLIWTVIGGIGLVLGYISFSMIKEMNQKEN